MKPTDKQEKEFWEGCGLKIINGLNCFTAPPIDLNNLFKYAVPKLSEDYYIDIMNYRDIWQGRIQSKLGIVGAVKVDEDPALALFWAIYEVVK